MYYDQGAQIAMPRWSRGRVVLIGDACQAVSLLAGQGASLGIAGAYVLAEQLTRAGSLEGGVARYERIWRPVVEEKQQTGRKSARWFLPQSQLQLRARRVLMKALGLPGGDRYLATTLAGKPTTVVKDLHTTPTSPRLAGEASPQAAHRSPGRRILPLCRRTIPTTPNTRSHGPCHVSSQMLLHPPGCAVSRHAPPSTSTGGTWGLSLARASSCSPTPAASVESRGRSYWRL
ncbi:FAD-dependent monooxygenase [Streptomyces sirii]|uniref:FAD-dependent monooxygenase n=1 Tax=Streptomyces sirii TaxID=3127701 RepID=UPI003D367C76